MTDQPEPTDFNRRVGANLRDARIRRGISQGQLAEMMTERGASFQQQTVLKVEKGARPLRLEEAAHLAALLEIEVSHLMEQSSEEAERAQLMLDGLRVGRELSQKRLARQALDAEIEELAQRRREIQEKFNATTGEKAPDGEH